MITLYSGTPGAGKSLHVARKIYERLRTTKRDVIATFPINMDIVTSKGKKKTANFIYCDITDLTVEYLISYALESHKLGKENQTLVVIDECQIIFNPREFSRIDRLKWIVFFTQHRKLGFDFILISQFDRLIDRQIRCLLEYNVVHRKVNNLGVLWLLPIKFFISINVWYGAKVKCGQEFFIYRKKYGKMYDSFMMFDDDFRQYINDNGEKVSQYNLDILGIEKPKKPNSENADVKESDIFSAEEERYTEMFKDLPDEVGSREVIRTEMSDAIDLTGNVVCDLPDNTGCGYICPNCKYLPKQDNVDTCADILSVEAGVRGSLPKQTEYPQAVSLISLIRNILNVTVMFKNNSEDKP